MDKTEPDVHYTNTIKSTTKHDKIFAVHSTRPDTHRAQQQYETGNNVILRRVHVTNLAVEKQQVLHICVWARVRAYARERKRAHARACM